MSQISTFENRVNIFFSDMPTNPSTSELSVRLKRVFMGPSDFTKENVKGFCTRFVEINTIETAAKVAKVLAGQVSLELAKEILFAENEVPSDNIESIPEEVRAFLLFRYCYLDHNDVPLTINTLNLFNVERDFLHYKCAVYFAKRGVKAVMEEFDNFNLKDEYRERLIEVALLFDPEAFFNDLNEVTSDSDEREQLYLKGLMRSVEVVDHLLEDTYFREDLERYSSEVLEGLYNLFEFGETLVRQEASDESEEAYRFSLLVKNEDSPPEGDFFQYLEEKEKNALISMLLFLKKLDDPERVLRSEVLIDLLEELCAFRDPVTRFAIVALVLDCGNETEYLEQLLKYYESYSTSDNPAIFSIVLYLLNYYGIGELKVYNGFLEQFGMERETDSRYFDVETFKHKWKDFKFRKAFIQFLAEVVVAKKCESKDSILLHCLCNNKLNEDMLLAYTACVRKRFYRQLAIGEDPHQILVAKLKSDVDEIGQPYNLNLTTQEVDNLQRTQELSYYVQSLQRLGESEKKVIVPCFFRFLKALATNTIEEMRYTDELRGLFKKYHLDWRVWNRDESYPLDTIPKDVLAPPGSAHNEFDICDQFKRSFEEDHLNRDRFLALFNYIQGEGDAPANPEDKYKDEIVAHRLYQVLVEEKPKKQIKLLKSLKGYMAENACLLTAIDLWIEAIKQSKGENNSFNFNEVLKQSFAEELLEKEKYPVLFAHIYDGSNPPGDPNEIHKDEKVMYLLGQLLEAKNPEVLKNALSRLKRYFPGKDDFRTDIANWIKVLNESGKDKKYPGYTCIRTCNPYILFLLGSVAGESCLRVTGDPKNNKSLLAYPCDGKNQAIIVTDSKGNIQARAIFRFFRTKNHSSLVLYLEPVYPKGTPAALKNAVTYAAIQCAQTLQIPLVRHLKPRETLSEETSCVYDIETINGPAPYEYYDGFDQGHKIKFNNQAHFKSIATIGKSKLRLLYKPDKIAKE